MGCLLLLCKYFFLSFFSLVFFSHNIDGKGELFRVLKNYRQVSWWDSFTAWWLFKTCPPLFMFKVNFDKLKLWNNNTPFFLFLRKASSTGLGREGEGGGRGGKGTCARTSAVATPAPPFVCHGGILYDSMNVLSFCHNLFTFP